MSENKRVLFCPACGKQMEIIHLDEQNIDVDVCLQGCGGIFLDNREFKAVDEQHEDITPIIEAKQNKTFIKTDTDKIRKCPLCHHNMVKNYSSHLKNVQVDECYNCGGKFLDSGELTQIRAEYETEQDRIHAFGEYAQKLIGQYYIKPL